MAKVSIEELKELQKTIELEVLKNIAQTNNLHEEKEREAKLSILCHTLVVRYFATWFENIDSSRYKDSDMMEAMQKRRHL
jgi:hypothetical protein